MASEHISHICFENGDDPPKRDNPDYDRVWKIKKIFIHPEHKRFV
jgi:hypothetical protein